MRKFERSVLLPYPARQVFKIVNDVARYAEFVPGVQYAEVLESDDTSMVARLDLGARGHKETLVTRNAFPTPDKILVSLVSGPFKQFSGEWAFVDLGEGCRVTLTMEFELDSRVIATVMAPFFNHLVDSTVDAFSSRARAVLGP